MLFWSCIYLALWFSCLSAAELIFSFSFIQYVYFPWVCSLCWCPWIRLWFINAIILGCRNWSAYIVSSVVLKNNISNCRRKYIVISRFWPLLLCEFDCHISCVFICGENWAAWISCLSEKNLLLAAVRHENWAATWQKQQNECVRPAKTQISWASAQSDQSSLSAWRNLGSLATHWAHSKDWSDWADAQADLSLR